MNKKTKDVAMLTLVLVSIGAWGEAALMFWLMIVFIAIVAASTGQKV